PIRGNPREWMTSMGRRSAGASVAHLFCELYLKLEVVGLARDHTYQLPLTQQDVGDARGLSNVHVNRVLRDLRESGLISWRRGGLEITDWQELAKLCDFDPTYLHLDRGAT
ncbi:Crp/Fnr family transcriptional regulator, partial [Methylobacterium platani]